MPELSPAPPFLQSNNALAGNTSTPATGSGEKDPAAGENVVGLDADTAGDAYRSDKNDDILLACLEDARKAGRQSGGRLKPETWKSVVAKLAPIRQRGAIKTIDNSKSHFRNLKVHWQEVHQLLQMSGFGWDEAGKKVTAEADVWEQLLNPRLRTGLSCITDKGSYGAPKAFRGDKPDRLESFLRSVDKIITSYEVTDETESAKILFGFLRESAKDLFLEHPSYKEGKYDEMLKARRSLNPSRKHKFKYTSGDLERIAKKWHKKRWSSLEHVAAYKRTFEIVGLWCLNHKKIEPERYNCIFWDGLSKNL
ncbi:unnamed protein product [Tilletia controversa]|nr:unnamed protein product [Tilletia controversa]